MKYKKPEIVVYGEVDATEWAIPQKDSTQHLPLVACGRSSPVGCMCTSSGSKAKVPHKAKEVTLPIIACHCTNGGARVSYKVQESSLPAIKAA